MVRLRSRAAFTNRESEPETSDDDDGDEDIPNEPVKIPTKRNGTATLRPHKENRLPKRPLSTESSSPQPLQSASKRQKTGNTVPNIPIPSRNIPLSLHPTSTVRSPMLPQVVNAKAQANSKSSGSDSGDDEMLQIVNSMINPPNAQVRRHSSEGSPSDHLIQEQGLGVVTNGISPVEGIEDGVEESSDEPGATDIPHLGNDATNQQESASSHQSDQGSPVATDEEQDAGDEQGPDDQDPSAQVEDDPDQDDDDYDDADDDYGDDDVNGALPSDPPSNQHDPYKIPLSPTPTHTGENGVVTKPKSSQENLHGAYEHELYTGDDMQDHPAESMEATNAQETAPVPESEPLNHHSTENDPDDPENVPDNDPQEDGDADGVARSEGEENGDPEFDVEEAFARDVADFENRHVPKGEKLPDIFRELRQDDIVAIHLEPDVLNRAMNLMKRNGWTGLCSDWPCEVMDMETAETQHCQQIIPLLAKLKRLYQVTPDASSLPAQHAFLIEHEKMISYYISRIQHFIDRVLGKQRHRTLDNVPIRTDMAEDVVTFIIPMMLQALTAAWRLGDGAGDGNTHFTAFSVKLLTKGLEGLGSLYEKAVTELSKKPPESYVKNWEAQRKNRERLRPLLAQLTARIRWAPGRLAKEHEAIVEKQRALERQREVELQRDLYLLEKQRRVREQNRRAFLSIREKTRSWTPSPSSPPMGTTTTSRRAATPPRSPPRVLPWTQEERKFLFKELQQAYPKLPDLGGYVRQALDREADDVYRMARKILKAMLTEAYGSDASPAEVERETERMFRALGNGRHQ